MDEGSEGRISEKREEEIRAMSRLLRLLAKDARKVEDSTRKGGRARRVPNRKRRDGLACHRDAKPLQVLHGEPFRIYDIEIFFRFLQKEKEINK